MLQQSKYRKLDWLNSCNIATLESSCKVCVLPQHPFLRKNLSVWDVSSSQCQETSNSLSFYLVLISVTPNFLSFLL